MLHKIFLKSSSLIAHVLYSSSLTLLGRHDVGDQNGDATVMPCFLRGLANTFLVFFLSSICIFDFFLSRLEQPNALAYPSGAAGGPLRISTQYVGLEVWYIINILY